MLNSTTNASSSSPRQELIFIKPSTARSPRPPDTYFVNSAKQSTNKPLVSIETYPTPNQRPQPKKMDFLPGGSTTCNAKTDPPSRDKLQNELTSTLKRSNLRQRCIPQDLPETTSNANTITYFAQGEGEMTGEEFLNQANGPPSLSEKYQSLATSETGRPTVSIIVKGNEDSNISFSDSSPPTGILKPVGVTMSSSRTHLHKSISFGDV